MSAPIEISKDNAKAYLLRKQFLLPPRALEGMDGIETVFSNLHAVQYDPQNPCGRNIDLFLQARVKGVRPNDHYHWLYKLRKGIETYDKELCVVPIEELPLCRNLHPVLRKKRTDEFLRTHRKALDHLVSFIAKNGSMSSIDVIRALGIRATSGTFSWSKTALEALWRNGEIVVSGRKNGRKFYDLPRNVYGESYHWNSSGRLLTEEHVLRRIGCVGLLPKSGTGQAWLGVGKGSEISPLIEKMLAHKRLIEVHIANISRPFVVGTADEPLVLKGTAAGKQRLVCFLPPLDNLLWDRRMISEIFDFDYKWEAYTPMNKRQYGHYVLPILYGTNFIGRIEPKLQTGGHLEIIGLWKESSKKWSKEILIAFEQYIDSFMKYANAVTVTWQ